MSVFDDFQRLWMQRFPQSSLSDAWEQDVRASLERHKLKITELSKELEQETLYVEYLERLLSDVEKYRESGGDPTTLFEAAGGGGVVGGVAGGGAPAASTSGGSSSNGATTDKDFVSTKYTHTHTQRDTHTHIVVTVVVVAVILLQLQQPLIITVNHYRQQALSIAPTAAAPSLLALIASLLSVISSVQLKQRRVGSAATAAAANLLLGQSEFGCALQKWE